MKATIAITGALASVLCGLGLLAALLGASAGGFACGGQAALGSPEAGSWLATAYGPPWGGLEGGGVTATGIDLRGGQPMLEVAVDPSVISLGSWVHVQPNPFATAQPFYAGDTGAAITGHHIDIYDWLGRASQQAWGARQVVVTPTTGPAAGQACPALLAPGQGARVLPDGGAIAPEGAPEAVRLAIAAGNLIHTRPYPEPDTHYGSLAALWPAYDCSGATSLVLYGAGLLGPEALDSSQLERYGLPGPGRWITIYANPAHAWIVVAGIALDTSGYGGPSLPAGSGPRWRAEPLANLRDGSQYVVRHPAGL